MKQRILKWTAAVLIVLTLVTFFLPWISLRTGGEALRAVTAELAQVGLDSTASALEDHRLTAFEAASMTMELGALFGSDAWLRSALGVTQSSAELAQLRFVCIAFLAVFCAALLFWVCDLVLCLWGGFLCKGKRTLRLLAAMAAPLFTGLLILIFLTAAELFTASLLRLAWGLTAAAVCTLGAAVAAVWAALEKGR